MNQTPTEESLVRLVNQTPTSIPTVISVYPPFVAGFLSSR
jgi:hypothetical protein